MSTGAQNPNYSALTLRIMWTIGLLCKCHVICQLFTFFHFAVDIELMKTVMLNNHDSNIFCPHMPGEEIGQLFNCFQNIAIKLLFLFNLFEFWTIGWYMYIVCVAKVSISLMSTVLSTFPVKQNKHCEMKLGICSQNNNSETYICTLLNRGTYL